MALFRCGAGDEHPLLSPMKCFRQKTGDTSSAATVDIISGTPVSLTGNFRGGTFIANIIGFNGTLSTTDSNRSAWNIFGITGDTVRTLSYGANLSNTDVSDYDYIVAASMMTSDVTSVTMTFTAT